MRKCCSGMGIEKKLMRIFLSFEADVYSKDPVKENVQRSKHACQLALLPSLNTTLPNQTTRLSPDNEIKSCDKILYGITKRSVWVFQVRLTLNSSHAGLVCLRCSSSVLLSELHTSDGAVSDGSDKQNGPNARDDSSNGEDQDVQSWNNERCA